jgi:hypothetical protein
VNKKGVTSGAQQEAFIKFTISGVHGPVVSATLVLFVDTATGSDTTDGPKVVLANNNGSDGNPWTETGITWDNKPAVIGTPVADSGALSLGQRVEFDVTSLVTGNGTYTFSLVGDVNNSAVFDSRNHDQNQPQLVVSFAPIGPTATPTMTPTPEPGLAAGYRDFSYTSAAVAPTQKEGQSKVWFAGGSWWGALFRPAFGDFYIYKLDLATQTWSPTGTVVDGRASAKIDAFFDAGTSKLYTVSSSISSSTSGQVEVRRFSFNGSGYSLDAGFPLVVYPTGTEDGVVTINKDGAGVLWVTFVPTLGDPRPYVTHTNGSDTSWVVPYVIPVAGTSLDEDDISVVVAFGGNIGVMWSNQTDGTMYFAWHAPGADDTAWTGEIAYTRSQGSDDHISLKADSSGRVYAATKTSLNGSDPLLLLLVRATNGTWSNTTFSTANFNQTRPVIVLNESAGLVYYFASGPCCSGGKIYYKQTSMSAPSFSPGAGTPVIDSSLDTTINNVSSTKQNVSGGMGVLIIAGDDNTTRYLHNWLP